MPPLGSRFCMRSTPFAAPRRAAEITLEIDSRYRITVPEGFQADAIAEIEVSEDHVDAYNTMIAAPPFTNKSLPWWKNSLLQLREKAHFRLLTRLPHSH